MVFCYLRFPSGIVAHLHLSWLDPHKERRLTVVGARRMATFDDMLMEGKLAVYDKGFDEDARSWGEYIARSGDIFSPRIPNAEPLRIECEHFLECIRTGATPRSDGTAGCAWCACSRRCSARCVRGGSSARAPRPAVPSRVARRRRRAVGGAALRAGPDPRAPTARRTYASRAAVAKTASAANQPAIRNGVVAYSAHCLVSVNPKLIVVLHIGRATLARVAATA